MKDEDKTKEQLKSDHDKSVKVLEQTDLKLTEIEEKYSIIFKTANDGILIADIETKKFVFANQTISKILG
jgi:PAS domain-containing protein